jgi:hypothetical protein
MPNWCNNSILIEGPVDKIRALWERAQTGHQYVNADTGKTEETSGLLEAMTPIGKWDYCTAVSTWGTKWDFGTDYLNYTENENGRAEIRGGADSAWSPPLEAFQAYANANEDVYLELKYFEPGMSFIGVWDSEGGDAYWEDVYQLVKSNADETDTVIAELFEEFAVWNCYEEDEEEEDEITD